jgi:hypothetical protein
MSHLSELTRDPCLPNTNSGNYLISNKESSISSSCHKPSSQELAQRTISQRYLLERLTKHSSILSQLLENQEAQPPITEEDEEDEFVDTKTHFDVDIDEKTLAIVQVPSPSKPCVTLSAVRCRMAQSISTGSGVHAFATRHTEFLQRKAGIPLPATSKQKSRAY